MRFLILGVLALSLLSPACERANLSGDQYDAGPVQPPDDGGSAIDSGAGTDARTPRPGAGPLDPDLTIDCVTSSYYQVALDRDTGRETSRSYPGRAVWQESELPTDSWVCSEIPYEPVSCYFGTETCAIRGSESQWQTICIRALWQVSIDGTFYVQCGGRSESDPDGDGIFEDPYPGLYRDSYLAIIR